VVEDNFTDHEDVLDAVIFENKEWGKQVRMTVSEFRGNHYLGLREYFLDFEGDWLPTKNGMSFPYNIDTTTNMFQAFTSILSRAEVIAEVFKNCEEMPKDEDKVID
jgi:hypothetical protein